MVVGDPSLNTLLHLKYHSTWRAKRGTHGGGKKRRGADAEDVEIRVPTGTVVWRVTGPETRELVADVSSTEPVTVVRGGTGGSGNSRFVSATDREPVLAERGEGGEEAILVMELKLLADVGLIGQPNCGKSTLISRCSAARPKIAPYPFTTKDPVLGVVAAGEQSFVMMEIPGLIAGAQRGVGLGLEFLRHAERARLLLHILDGMSNDPLGDLRRINDELTSYDVSLGTKPQGIVINKIDIPEVRERADKLKRALAAGGAPVFCVSAATGEGVDSLLARTMTMVQELPVGNPEAVPDQPATIMPTVEAPFSITRENGVYTIHAPRVERLIPLANLRDRRAMLQIWKQLQRLGVVKKLEEMGVEPGNTVRLGGRELEWF